MQNGVYLRWGGARPVQQHRVKAQRGTREERGNGRLREQAGRECRAAPVAPTQHGGHAAAARPEQHAGVGGPHHLAREVRGERQWRRGGIPLRQRRAATLQRRR
eukprot:scaffold125854_cov57-Phaeocystis_antarctica.AAC.2